MLQITLFPQSPVCPRSKELAKKLFAQASGSLVNRISILEFECEDKQKYLVSTVYKYRQQRLSEKKCNIAEILWSLLEGLRVVLSFLCHKNIHNELFVWTYVLFLFKT